MSQALEPALVALRMSPGPAFVEELYGAWEQGSAVLPLDPRLPAPEVQRILEDMRPSALVEDAGRTRLSQAMPVDAGVALVVLTSGTTGGRKGAELTHAALEASTRAAGARLGVEDSDRWLCCLPLSHVAGLSTIVRSMALGRPPVIHERFDPEAIAREERATLVALVPTMLARLLDARVAVDRYRVILLGGGPAPAPLLERARAAGANVVVSYGMTETCGGCVYDGVPFDDVEIAVAADGRIALRGPVVMSGYRNRPDLSARVLSRGWFTTSDVGELDARGRLTVTGRADDVIITGGEKVVPAEVERELRRHPRVEDALVFGRADDLWGERVVAMVVPAAGTEPPALEDLRRFIAGRMTAAGAPRELIVVDALPAQRSWKRGVRDPE
ncbi:o-succinylbenzoate--CoA ligase [soil metagenome]